MKTILRISAILLMILTSCYLYFQQGQDTETKQQAEETTDKTTQPATEAPVQETKIEVTLHRSDGSEDRLELETYLAGVVGSEMPASFEMEALKAQAVAARSFVAKRNFEVDDTTSSQVYQDDSQLQQVWAESYDEKKAKVQDAVAATKGEVMKYEGNVITASFFSSSPGKTANANEYWENDTPYLKSVDSHWDQEVNDGNIQTKEFNIQDFSQTLGFQNIVSNINDPQYYESGYVESITIDGITFSGREMRERLGLRSSCFSVARNQDIVTVTTTGFGHGIGMSQYGAQGMALEGYTYDEILHHYYTGVEIVSLYE